MRGSFRVVMVLAVLFCVYLPQATEARSWYVERDGSGDFTVIQDAVDVAASGDTIKIGPGRYDEKRLVTTPGWSDSVRVQVTQQELTFIGSGPETIVGPDQPWESERSLDKGFASSDLWGNSIIRVNYMRMENMGIAVYTSYNSSGDNLVKIEDCLFGGNKESVYLIGNGGNVRIDSCLFESVADDGHHVSAWTQGEIFIQDCIFTLSNEIYGQDCFTISDVENASIVDCEVYGGTVGATVIFNGHTAFRDCIFDGQGTVAIIPSAGSSVSVDSCTFRNQIIAMYSDSSDNQFTMSYTAIEDVTDCSFFVEGAGIAEVNNCDLAKGGRGVVWVTDRPSCTSIKHLDFTNNHWGTADADSIQAWIRDSNDTENACYYVDYVPFSDVPLPTEKKSLGGLKAMFRGR